MIDEPINVSELHIKWLVELMDNIDNLSDYEQNFVLDVSEKLQDGRITYLTPKQDAKLREIAYDRLVD